jgi:lycopene beta-cyclase
MRSGLDADIAIAGAGCAGLSLAVALAEAGDRRRIVLVDRRTGYAGDRTWCWWDVMPTPWSRLARARWSRWVVRTPAGEAEQSSRGHPYLCLAAETFYARALDRLARAPGVQLRLGEAVRAVGPDRLVTSAGELRAGLVFDARGAGSPHLRRREPAEVDLVQRFLGWEVETERPVFDPERATLMDFRVAQRAAPRFLYVLPFGPTRALVEDTTLGDPPLAADQRRAVLAEHLEALGAGAWRVVRSERGAIAMTTHPFALEPEPGVWALGLAAGAARPSSGYAFARIQAHVTAVARAVAAGAAPPRRLGHPRAPVMDRVFLRALAADPDAFGERFRRLAAGTSGDVLARFMMDASTPADELRIVAALPKRAFLAAAA